MSDGAPDRAKADLRQWRQYLANERAEAAVYRELAGRRSGEERAILLALADAEGRHEAHWAELLGPDIGRPVAADIRTRILGLLAKWFGSVFVLALAQRAEARSPYADDPHATAAMAADERIHGEVVRGLAARGRKRLSGTFRAAVFGANDGLVSNLALVFGIAATGVSSGLVLFSGIAGLLAGALSMGAGEYVSVRSQRELLEASTPDAATQTIVPDLDVDANELALVYRARGMTEEKAAVHAARVFSALKAAEAAPATGPLGQVDDYESVGTGLGAAASSFCFFASGALIPILPFIFGMEG
ncbi:MAG: VIT1/CCC1 family protein, partial [Leifsonia sp.]